MEVLTRFREAKQSGVEVRLEGLELVFADGTRVLRDQPTAFHGRKGVGDAYTADSVWGVAQWGDRPLREYVSECEQAGVSRVQMMDMRDLLPYLKGESDTASGIRAMEGGALDLPVVPQVEVSDGFPVQGDVIDSPVLDETLPTPRKRKSGHQSEGSLFDMLPTAVIDREALSRALKRERFQRTRDSILRMPGTSYEPILKRLIAHVEKKNLEEIKNKRKTATGGRPDEANKPEQATFDPRGDRYRVKEDTVWKEAMGGDIRGINTAGSFKQSHTTPTPDASLDSTPETGKSSGAKSSRTPLEQPGFKRPIIILPTGSTSILSSENAVEFFRKAKFHPLQRSLGSTKTQAFQRISPRGNRIEYSLVSNPRQLEPSEWGQVIAVVCSGADWQFKDWPDQSPKEALARVRGFYFFFDDDKKAAGAIADWNVTRIPISKSKRHLDEKACIQFWQDLDAHVAKNAIKFAM
uniref:Cell division control protein 73 C-terminal domain-containing protein n=1 Tax=Compsopogon caeruleus TaxID=31354 RepID=A0A7S1XGB3_9RHOD